MHQPNFSRRLRHGCHPVAKSLLVGVGRVACQAVDGGFGRGAAQGECRDVNDAVVGQGVVQGLCQDGLAVDAVFVVPVGIGGFQDQQVTGIGQIRVRKNRGVFAAQVPGKGDAKCGSARVVWIEKRKLDKAGAQDVAGIFKGKGVTALGSGQANRLYFIDLHPKHSRFQ